MSDPRVPRLADALTDRALIGDGRTGDRPGVVRAPGRVNLIGDHTDYNDGLVLPLAIDRDCLVAWQPRVDERVTVRSLDRGEHVEVAADGRDDIDRVEPDWAAFVIGMLRALREQGCESSGVDLAVASTVPPGSGLSSSAALAVGLGLAITTAAGARLDRRELARVSHSGPSTSRPVSPVA